MLNHRNNDLKINKSSLTKYDKQMLLVILLAVIARLFLTLLPSYRIDMEGYKAWSKYLAANGAAGFYETYHVVYGPVYLYLLAITGKLVSLFSLNIQNHEFLIKLWSVIADFISAYLIFTLGRKIGKGKKGFVIGILYFLNPVVIFDSSIWGQFDSICAAMLLEVIYLFDNNRKIAAVLLFGTAVLLKPQSAFLAPIVLLLYFKDFSLRRVNDWKRLGLTVVGGIAVYLAFVMPFTFNKPIYWVIDLYLFSGGDYPYATANGFNLWTLLGGQAVNDSEPFLLLTYASWSIILLFVSVVFCSVLIFKRWTSDLYLYYLTYLLQLAVFFFGTRMHERYLFPAFIFLFACMLWDIRLALPGAVLSLCGLANQWYIYEKAKSGIYWIDRGDTFATLFALLTLIVFIYSIYYSLKKMNKLKVQPMSYKF